MSTRTATAPAPVRPLNVILITSDEMRAMFMRADVLAYCAAHAVAFRRISEL
ncbi:MAG: hypothetical protein NTV22_09185 [bacterium]|nr:hypothetical protein [bacterium]